MENRQEIRDKMFAHIEQWKDGMLTQIEYCRQHGLVYSSFHYWYKRYRIVNDLPKASFVKLQVTGTFSTATAELICTDGKRLVFHQPVSSGFLKALIS